MQIERERRFRLTSDTYLRLLSLADWSPPNVVTDVTMGHNGQQSMETDGWVVRLRTEGGRSSIQFKGRLATDQEHLEAAVGIDSVADAAELLSLMGLRLGLVINRTRRYADLNGAHLALDDVSGLGHFLEVELDDDEDCGIFAFLARHIDVAAECGTYGDLILDRQRTDSTWADRYRQKTEQVLASLQLQHLQSGYARWRDHG
ncbi:MAG: CYTH domain-containing protein [Pseudonocardiaceae bacterium]